MGWASRANPQADKAHRADIVRRALQLRAIRRRVEVGESLTRDDELLLLRCGPEALKYVGLQRVQS